MNLVAFQPVLQLVAAQPVLLALILPLAGLLVALLLTLTVVGLVQWRRVAESAQLTELKRDLASLGWAADDVCRAVEALPAPSGLRRSSRHRFAGPLSNEGSPPATAPAAARQPHPRARRHLGCC